MSEHEQLREALLDLERARLRDHQRRLESTSLHAGMAALTRHAEGAVVFAELFQAFRAALDFDDALVLTETKGTQTLRVFATTNRAFEGAEFPAAELFARVFAGSPAAIFDVAQVPEWSAARAVDADLHAALHVQASTRDRRALLVFTHARHGAFGPREARLAKRFAPLVSQALLKGGPDRWANYELLEKIGNGGMGEVYLARQRMQGGLTRQVILKTILPELARHSPIVQQFLDEARVASTLNHPNIVSIVEVGKGSRSGDQGWFIAMEYIHGVDLMQLATALAAEQRALPIPALIAVVRDAARGLHHAHTAVDAAGAPLGVVHRDVSPQNIMVRLDGVTKIVDFGIAQTSQRLEATRPGAFRGKLSYMSPEQAGGEVIDARSDQFSLGVVAWELCTGRRLFHTDNPLQTMRRLLSGAITRPRAHRPELPEAVEAVLLKMLRTHVGDRYASLAEVADALDATLSTDDRRFDIGALVRDAVQVLTALAAAKDDRRGGPAYDGEEATAINDGPPADEEPEGR